MKILLFRASVAPTFNLPLPLFLMLPLLCLYVNPVDSNKISRSLLRRVQGNCIHGSRIISSRSKCVRIIFSKYVTYLTEAFFIPLWSICHQIILFFLYLSFDSWWMVFQLCTFSAISVSRTLLHVIFVLPFSSSPVVSIESLDK